MNINLSEEELSSLVKILEKEISFLEKEIHRTDALGYKHELEEKNRFLLNLRSKLQPVYN